MASGSTVSPVSWTQALDATRGSIRTIWLACVSKLPTNDPRITDYAKPLVELIDLYNPSMFSRAENQSIQQFLRTILHFLWNESFVQPRHADSNWQAYRLWVMARIGVVLKQADVIMRVRDGLRQYVARNTVARTGALKDFEWRDSLTYQVYTMYAIVQTIKTLEPPQFNANASKARDGRLAVGIWWRGDSSLQSLTHPHFRFLRPYLDGVMVHREFLNSQIKSDLTRPDAGLLFNPRSAEYLLREVADWPLLP